MCDRRRTSRRRFASVTRFVRLGSSRAAWQLRGLAVVGVFVLAFCSSAAAAPDLLRTTTISGSSTGYTEVELTQTLYPNGQDMPTVTFNGGGQFIAAVLRPVSSPHAPMLAEWQTPDLGASQSYGGNSDGALPAGLYRLYLGLVDTGSVTLTFPSLPAGTLSLTPDTPSPMEFGPLAITSTGTVAKFGQSRVLTGGGFALVRMTVSTPPPGAMAELCWYPGGDAAAGASAYDPGCPQGQSVAKGPVLAPNSSNTSVTVDPNTTDIEGEGGNMSVPIGSAGGFSAFGMWMAYDPPQAPGGSPGQPGASSGPSGPAGPAGPPGSGGPAPAGPGYATASGSGSCTTSSCPSSSGRMQQPHGQTTGAWTASLESRRILLHGKWATVPLACRGPDPCRGHVGFVRAQQKYFAIQAGRHVTLLIAVPRSIRRQVTRHRLMNAALAITSRLADQTLTYRAIVQLETRT
jgi:hypothetical protein